MDITRSVIFVPVAISWFAVMLFPVENDYLLVFLVNQIRYLDAMQLIVDYSAYVCVH
jgi:hypothetical protein